MAQPKEEKWLEYPPMEISKYAAPVILKDEFALLASSSPDEGLYSLDLGKNKLVLVWKYPLGFEPLRHTVLVDDCQTVYIYNTIPSACDSFYEIDLNTKQHTLHKGSLHGLPEGLGNESGGCAVLQMLNNSIHAIGGYTNGYHSVWHSTSDHDKVAMFKQYQIGNRSPKTSLYGHGVLKHEVKNQLIVLGGNSSMMFGGYLRDIWVCNTTNDIQWTKLGDITMPYKMYYFGYVQINNERYGHKGIIFGGKSSSGVLNEIWTLDLDTWQWTKSEKRCPKKAMYYAVITDNNDIHLFEINKTGHWKMRLSEIMPHAKKKHIRSVSSIEGQPSPMLAATKDNGSSSASSSQSKIDLDIITSLKTNLVQEKKASRLLKKQNEKINERASRHEEKISMLAEQNEQLQHQLQTMQNLYDELSADFNRKEDQYSKLNDEEEEYVLHQCTRYKWRIDAIGWTECDAVDHIQLLNNGCIDIEKRNCRLTNHDHV